jgi:hypothetical protein
MTLLVLRPGHPVATGTMDKLNGLSRPELECPAVQKKSQRRVPRIDLLG